MIRPLRSRRGFALILVISVMALLIIYLVAVQGSIQMTRIQKARSAQKRDRAEAAAALIALAIANPQAGTSGAQMDVPGGFKARLERTPLPPEHAIWQEYPTIKPFSGDELVRLSWIDVPGTEPTDSYIINRQGRRTGVICLPRVLSPWIFRE